MRMKCLRTAGALVILVIAVIAVLGHICMLPVHAHAVPVEGHGSHDEDSAGHSVHTASCDAIKTTPSAAALIPGLAATSLPVVTATSCPLQSAPHPVVRAKSPPLFLLHTALLI